MKRLLAFVLCAVILMCLVACSDNSGQKAPSSGVSGEENIPGMTNFPDGGSKGLEYAVHEDGASCTVTGIGECTDVYISVGDAIDGYMVTAVADSAFYCNTELKGILLGKNVISVGDYAFFGCTGLEVVTLGENVASLGRYAFAGCVGLKTIAISENVAWIGAWAFYGCTGLTSVTAADLESWCAIVFDGVYANPVMEAEQLYVGEELLTKLTLPEDMTAIGDWAFAGCTSLTEVALHENLTQIGQRAFMDCANLSWIAYPGTAELWKGISLGAYWDFSIEEYVIACEDEEIKG